MGVDARAAGAIERRQQAAQIAQRDRPGGEVHLAEPQVGRTPTPSREGTSPLAVTALESERRVRRCTVTAPGRSDPRACTVTRSRVRSPARTRKRSAARPSVTSGSIRTRSASASIESAASSRGLPAIERRRRRLASTIRTRSKRITSGGFWGASGERVRLGGRSQRPSSRCRSTRSGPYTRTSASVISPARRRRRSYRTEALSARSMTSPSARVRLRR